MPLSSNDIPNPLGVTQTLVAPNIWLSTESTPDDVTVLRTGNDRVQVNVTKAEANGQATAMGRALSFLRAHSDEPVILAGPDAERIVEMFCDRG